MKKEEEKKVRLELMRKLKEIYDDRDFVCGTVSVARDPEIWVELLHCIKVLEDEEERISSDDILALALILRKEADERKASVPSHKKVSVAML